MTQDDFWSLIDNARAEADDHWEAAARLEDRLAATDPSTVYSFLERQVELMVSSYSWKLWGAAYLINGGCSDDGFEYFRGWLIVSGREVFEKALADPDSLADLGLEMEDAECEDLLYAGGSAYQALTGDYPDGPPVRYPDLGEGWDFDDAAEMRARYPRLFEQFGWD